MSAWTVSASAPVVGARHLAARGHVAQTRVTTSAPRVAVAPARGATLRVSAEASEKNLEVMRKFSEQYAKGSGTYFCMDKSVTAVVIQGLAEHKDTLGAPLCPCRHYDDKEAEVASGFWNCPCVPMRERKECHCMLFLTEDNDFVGTSKRSPWTKSSSSPRACDESRLKEFGVGVMWRGMKKWSHGCFRARRCAGETTDTVVRDRKSVV